MSKLLGIIYHLINKFVNIFRKYKNISLYMEKENSLPFGINVYPFVFISSKSQFYVIATSPLIEASYST